MCINTQLSHGFLSAVNRRALHRCLFNGSKAKLLAKILRIRAFYRSPSSDISWLQVLLIVSCMSMRFASMCLLTLPLLTFPTKVWPQYILKRLGKEGSVYLPRQKETTLEIIIQYSSIGVEIQETASVIVSKFVTKQFSRIF